MILWVYLILWHRYSCLCLRVSGQKIKKLPKIFRWLLISKIPVTICSSSVFEVLGFRSCARSSRSGLRRPRSVVVRFSNCQFWQFRRFWQSRRAHFNCMEFVRQPGGDKSAQGPNRGCRPFRVSPPTPLSDDVAQARGFRPGGRSADYAVSGSFPIFAVLLG